MSDLMAKHATPDYQETGESAQGSLLFLTRTPEQPKEDEPVPGGVVDKQDAAPALKRVEAWLKTASTPETVKALSGRLIQSSSGWLLLEVPNALVRGAFQALDEPGTELPPSGPDGKQLKAHISVVRPEEIEQAGGIERFKGDIGKHFHYTLGPVQVVNPHGWSEMAKAWFIKVDSPELKAFRRSHGLTALPNKGKFDLHITIAVRRGANKAAEEGVQFSGRVDDEDPDEVLQRLDAHVGGRNVGYLTTHPATEGGIWLKGMYVDPVHRGQGLASSLLREVLAKHPTETLRLRARPYRDKPLSGAQLQAFYSRFGFEPSDDEGRMVRKVAQDSGTERPKTVAVDLDGTLAKYDGWKGEDHIGDPRPGAGAALEEFQRLGWRIIVFTTRGDEQKIKEWLHRHDIPFNYINHNPDQPEGASGKVIADLYLDDRALNARMAWSRIQQEAVKQMKRANLTQATQETRADRANVRRHTGQSLEQSPEGKEPMTCHVQAVQVMRKESVSPRTLIRMAPYLAATGLGGYMARGPAGPKGSANPLLGGLAGAGAAASLLGAKALYDRFRAAPEEEQEPFTEQDIQERLKSSSDQDKIEGGLADQSNPSDFSQAQLQRGTQVEHEHTSNEAIAREIAMDHLREDPRYYSKHAKDRPSPEDVSYAGPNPDGSTKQCGNCVFFAQQVNQCSLMEPEVEVLRESVCNYHVYGEPQDTRQDFEGLQPLDPQTAGFIHKTPGGTVCGNCQYYRGDERRGTCQYVQGPDQEDAEVQAKGCCNAWEPQDKEATDWTERLQRLKERRPDLRAQGFFSKSSQGLAPPAPASQPAPIRTAQAPRLPSPQQPGVQPIPATAQGVEQAQQPQQPQPPQGPVSMKQQFLQQAQAQAQSPGTILPNPQEPLPSQKVGTKTQPVEQNPRLTQRKRAQDVMAQQLSELLMGNRDGEATIRGRGVAGERRMENSPIGAIEQRWRESLGLNPRGAQELGGVGLLGSGSSGPRVKGADYDTFMRTSPAPVVEDTTPPADPDREKEEQREEMRDRLKAHQILKDARGNLPQWSLGQEPPRKFTQAPHVTGAEAFDSIGKYLYRNKRQDSEMRYSDPAGKYIKDAALMPGAVNPLMWLARRLAGQQAQTQAPQHAMMPPWMLGTGPVPQSLANQQLAQLMQVGQQATAARQGAPVGTAAGPAPTRLPQGLGVSGARHAPQGPMAGQGLGPAPPGLSFQQMLGSKQGEADSPIARLESLPPFTRGFVTRLAKEGHTLNQIGKALWMARGVHEEARQEIEGLAKQAGFQFPSVPMQDGRGETTLRRQPGEGPTEKAAGIGALIRALTRLMTKQKARIPRHIANLTPLGQVASQGGRLGFRAAFLAPERSGLSRLLQAPAAASRTIPRSRVSLTPLSGVRSVGGQAGGGGVYRQMFGGPTTAETAAPYLGSLGVGAGLGGAYALGKKSMEKAAFGGLVAKGLAALPKALRYGKGLLGMGAKAAPKAWAPASRYLATPSLGRRVMSGAARGAGKAAVPAAATLGPLVTIPMGIDISQNQMAENMGFENAQQMGQALTNTMAHVQEAGRGVQELTRDPIGTVARSAATTAPQAPGLARYSMQNLMQQNPQLMQYLLQYGLPALVGGGLSSMGGHGFLPGATFGAGAGFAAPYAMQYAQPYMQRYAGPAMQAAMPYTMGAR